MCDVLCDYLGKPSKMGEVLDEDATHYNLEIGLYHQELEERKWVDIQSV